MIEFFVSGEPQPEPKKKGAFRFLKGGGMGIKTKKDDETGEKTSWRSTVEIEARKYFCNYKAKLYDAGVPISVDLVFYRTPPKKKVNDLPVVMPDLDNFAYLVTNALKGICYHDDNQIVESFNQKFYADKDHPAGVKIEIKEVSGVEV